MVIGGCVIVIKCSLSDRLLLRHSYTVLHKYNKECMFYICVICLFTVHRSMLLYLTTFIVFLCHTLTDGFTHILTDTTPILYIYSSLTILILFSLIV